MTTNKRRRTALTGPTAKDLDEAKRRAEAAKTPIAKIVTRKVVEGKRQAYSGKPAGAAAVPAPAARKASPKRRKRR